MKILVGILYSGENEFEQCIASINRQKRVDFDIYRVSGKKNAEAHDELYGYFMEHSGNYDILVKVDADMVICVDNLFEMIHDEFCRNKLLDRLFVPVFDHFVLDNLGGVNAYRNTVTWEKNAGLFFTDMVHRKQSIRETVKWEVPSDKPLIDHCPDPGTFQSFHFGFHRTMKAFQPGSRLWQTRIQKIHWNSIRRMYRIGLEDMLRLDRCQGTKVPPRNGPHLPRLYALAGSECALSGRYRGEHIQRSDPSVHAAFKLVDEKIRNGATLNELTPLLKSALNRRTPLDYWFQFIKFRLTT